MGFLPKRLTLQNLDQVSVYVEDTGNKYFNVQEIPNSITQGRSAFKIFGSDFIQPDVELKIELLDSNRNPIFIAPVDFIGEEVPPFVPYRYVTIEVYSPPINSPGIATLTILGQIRDNRVFQTTPEDRQYLDDVPIEFQDAYNVRFQTKINIDLSTVVNTQPIRFFKNPTTEFEEILQPKTILTPLSQSVVTTTASGITRSDIRGKLIEIESGSLEKESLPREVSDTFKDIRRFKDEFKYKTGLRGRIPSIISKRGLSTVFASKEEPKFKIRSDNPIFSADMQGGALEIPERQIKLTKTNPLTNQIIEETVDVPKFKTKILEVIDDKTIIPEEPPLITLPTGSSPTNTDIEVVTVEDFTDTPITASFNVTAQTVTQSSIHVDSLLDLTLNNLRTFSGDIYRIRVHGKSESAGSDFVVLNDTVVESQELLIDSDSSSGVLRTGYFLNQNHVNTYWNTFSLDGNVKGTEATADYTGSELIDSIFISGSNFGLDESIVVETKPLRPFTVRKNVGYTLTAKVKGRTTEKIIDGNNTQRKLGKLYFHLSGSNLNTTQTKNNTLLGSELTDDSSGQPVVLQLDDDIEGIQNFETIEHTFTPRFNLDRTINKDTILQIRADAGQWFISDLSLRPAMDTGFSPDEFTLKVPIPRSTRPDRFDFLIEYFDINNNVSETVTVVQDVPISGSALVIDGDGNLLTGSLFMGNAVDSGIEAAGINSAFVRSVGYEGFQSASIEGKGGFIIFSGSVLPDAPDNYEGAGLEIHDGTTGSNQSFFKFRTNPSVLDIKTSTFFFGQESGPSNFISGSNGNLQISSSNFELSPEGNVTMSGEVSATGGSIGGFNIASTTISTTGVTLGNSTEELFISSSQFKVDHEGNITASNIDLGGTISATSGDVGGFLIEEGSLTAGSGNSAITMSSANKIISIGSGSTFNKGELLGGVRMGIDTDGNFKFAVGTAASFIHADQTGVSIRSEDINVTASLLNIDVDIFKLSANNLFISSSEGGFISAGNPRPTGITGNNKGVFISGRDPSDTKAKFLVGTGNGDRISFDGDNIFMSSSAFFLGSPSQFVSGSNGNIEISSSNFHLDNEGNVVMSGDITANAGTLGGFTIGGGAISSDNFFISGAADNQEFFISASNFNVKASGQVTASALKLTGGTAGGLAVSQGEISVGEILKFKSTGDITGSKVSFIGGTIGGLTISENQVAVGEILRLKDSGQITGSDVLFTGGKIASFDITDDVLSNAPNFFISGSATGDEFFISSSKFNVKASGDVSASSILLGNKGASNFLEFNDDTLTVQGSITADAISVPSAADTPSSSLDSGGLLKTVSASIGGFEIDDHSIRTTGIEFNNSTQSTFISSSKFKVDHSGNVTASNVDLSGKITATSGEIGGFTIDGHSLTTTGVEINDSSQTQFISSSGFKVDHTGGFILGGATNFLSGSQNNIKIFNSGETTLSGSQVTIQTPKFFLGGGSQFISGSNGNIEISSSKFHVRPDGDVVTNDITASNANVSGKITATSGEIGGFTIGDDLSNTAGSTLKLKGASGQLTASSAQITGKITAQEGTIGGFNIGDDLSNSSGGSNALRLKGDSGQITASKAQITGQITAQSGEIAGFTISGNTLTATNFILDTSNKLISLGTGDTILIADADTGIQLGDATFADAPFSVTTGGVLKATSGTIGGWSLSSNTIVGSNLTLNSSGRIETNDFVSGVKGFRLDSVGNGTAEFENISIRGTLKTTVFEKETVNAVGGQLYVANSTTLTGSLAISASATTMSVVNVTGFTGSYNDDGEILVAKKITDTGFSTEYILVQSASRDNPSSETDFSGKLFVKRGFQSGSTGEFLGDDANLSQSLSPGQVLASTGRIGTGYIRLNANPSDTTTPFIDIVERTGSSVFDVDLKARLGDLSGLSSEKLHGTDPSDAGFGLYSQNVFLEGGIVANTGSIGGIEMEAGKLYNGVGNHGNSDTGFYVDSSSKFSLGDKLVWDGSSLTVEGAINITGGGAVSEQLAALNLATGSLESSVDDINQTTASLESTTQALNAETGSLQTNIDNVEANVSGAFTSTSASLASDLVDVETNVSGAFTSTSASLASTIDSVEANISGAFTSTSASLASTITTVSSSTAERIVTDVSGSILSIPAAPSGEGLFLSFPHMGYYSGSQFNAFISASGGFLFKADDNNLISFGQSVSGGDGTDTKSFVLKSDNVFLSGSKVNILGERFFLGGSGQFVSGSGGNIEISSSKFHVRPDGDVVMNQITASDANVSGKITTSEGSIGGFDIGASQISSSEGGLILNADGGITGSKFKLTGGVITSDVVILGDLSANSIATPSTGDLLAQITSQGFARFVSASIGGFDVDGTEIKSTNQKLVMSSLGQITASDAFIRGDITANTINATGSGVIGGFKISSSQIRSEPNGSNTSITVTNNGSSNYVLDGEAQPELTFIVGNTYVFTMDSSVMSNHPFRFATQANGAGGSQYSDGVTITSTTATIVVTSDTPSTLYYYCTNHGGMGNSINVIQPPLVLDGGNGQITGSDVLISGGQISGSNLSINVPNVTMSGSSVDIRTSKFFLGESSQFISGSNGKVEISSSNFHLDNAGNVALSGNITATTGEIGGFTIGDDLSNSAGSTLKLKGSTGQITASAALINGNITADTINATGSGIIGGFTISETEISASGLLLKSSGQITASAVDLSGKITADSGTIGGFTIDSEKIQSLAGGSSTSLTVTAPGGSSEGYRINDVVKPTLTFVVGNTYVFDISDSSLGSHPFRLGTSANGNIITDGVTITSDELTIVVTSSTPTTLYYFCTNHNGMGNSISVIDKGDVTLDGTNGQVTASKALITGDITANTITANTAGQIGGFGITSSEISSSNADGNTGLRLKSSGQITASAALISGNITAATINATGSGVIGGFSIDQTSISSSNDNLILRSSGQITASAAKITGDITANTITANTAGTIANFNINSTEIASSNNNLRLKANGQITASSALINGNITADTINATGSGVIGGFTITPTAISSSTGQLILSSNGQITASAVSMSGTISATSGLIGGMSIETNSIQSTADAGDGSTTTFVVTVVSDEFVLDGVTRPSLVMIPGNKYRFDLSDDSNGGGHFLRFSEFADGDNGGGVGTDLFTTGVVVSGTAGSPGAYVEITVTQATPTNLFYLCSTHGAIGGSILVDKTSPLILDGNTGQISGSRFLFTGGKISGSNVEINVDNITMSGSSVDIKTPKFFLGSDSQFVSGSNGNIEISSSQFHLNPADNTMALSGSITATDGTIGGFSIGTNKLENVTTVGAFATSASINLRAGTNPIIELRRAKTGSGENDLTATQMTRNAFQAGFSSGSNDSADIIMTAGSTTTLISKAQSDGFIGSFRFENEPSKARAQLELQTDSLGIGSYSFLDGTSNAKGFLAVATQSAHPFASTLGFSNAPTHSINFFVGEDKGSHILYDGRTGEMELSSSSFRFGRVNRLNPTSATFVTIGGIDTGYSVLIGNPIKTDFLIEDGFAGVRQEGNQINNLGDNRLGKPFGRNIRVITTDGDSTNQIKFMSGSSISEHRFFDNKAQIRRQDGNHLFVSDKLEFRKPSTAHGTESSHSLFSVGDDVLLYGTSSVEPEFSITKTDDDNASLKFELSTGETLFQIIGGSEPSRVFLGKSAGTNFHIRNDQKIFTFNHSGTQTMMSLQDTDGRPKLTLSGSMTGPDLIVSSSYNSGIGLSANTGSFNYLQIGGTDYDGISGAGPFNGSITFGENSDHGYTIKQNQGNRELNFFLTSDIANENEPKLKLRASGNTVVMNGNVSASGDFQAITGSLHNIKVTGRSLFGTAGGTANAAHQFYGLGGGYTTHFSIFDTDGEEIMKASGTAAGSDLKFEFGDVAGAANGTIYTVDDGNTKHVFDGGFVDITTTTDATDATGDTGALRVEGGASIAKKVFVGTDLDVGGTYTNNTQPAFLALNSGTDNNLAIDTDVKIEFNQEVYDQASNFDNGTDTFTAPVTGKYLLTTQLRLDDIDTASNWTSIRIVTSNREYRRFIDPNFSADLNQFGMNMTVVADMDAGDTAHVEFKQSGGTAQVDVNSGNPGESPPQLDTFFSGYLLG